MTPRQRSLTGAALAVLTLPAVLGILACLPVPIGDPEKSRVDADLNGLWLKWDDGPGAMAFEPWDRRTWLVNSYEFEVKDCMSADATGDDANATDAPRTALPDDPRYEDLIAFIRNAPDDCADAGEEFSYKVWLTRLGDNAFLTWEPKRVFDKKTGFEPEFWFVFRIDKISPDTIRLWEIDLDYEGFEELDENKYFERLDDDERPRDPGDLRGARRALEKLVRQHADDPDMYGDESTVLFRIRPEDYDLFVGDLVPTLH